MTGIIEHHSAYLESFTELANAGPAGSWLQELRKDAMRHFAEIGFPSTHDEDWRFTNVAPIARTVFERARESRFQPNQLEAALAWDEDSARLVFVNGRYSPELSVIPDGMGGTTVGRLREGGHLTEAHLARHADFRERAFVALNTAFLEDGAFVHVPKRAVVRSPIHLVFLCTGEDRPSVCYPRILVVADQESQATFIESYIGFGNQVYFTNAVTEIVAGENAVIDHYRLELEAGQAYHVGALQASLGHNANFTSHSISLGGGLVRNDAGAVLAEGAECTLNGFYMLDGAQHVDNHTIIDHAKPHGTSRELYKGILAGRSSAVFNGKILVRQDAQKTDARQTNKNLLLSEDAAINTKPELQIFADDVKCTHGATIGQIDREALFYLQSRGIGEAEARSLLIFAFARDVFDRIKPEPLRARLEQILFERLAATQTAGREA